MKRIYLMGAAVLVASCGQATEPTPVDDVEAVNGEYETCHTDDSEGDAPDDDMTLDEVADARPIDGRRGLQYAASSDDMTTVTSSS